MIKKIRSTLFLFLTLSILDSCRATSALWHPSYEENFRSFLLTTNREVVFVGKKYHYAFNDQFGIMKDILFSETNHLVFINTEKTTIKVDSEDNIEGSTVIEAFNNRMNKEDYVYLKSLGFNSLGNEPLSLQLPLYGTRYSMSQFSNSQYARPLDRNYSVTVHYESTVIGTTGKIILTPFAVALDILLDIGKIILIPIQSN